MVDFLMACDIMFIYLELQWFLNIYRNEYWRLD